MKTWLPLTTSTIRKIRTKKKVKIFYQIFSEFYYFKSFIYFPDEEENEDAKLM